MEVERVVRQLVEAEGRGWWWMAGMKVWAVLELLEVRVSRQAGRQAGEWSWSTWKTKISTVFHCRGILKGYKKVITRRSLNMYYSCSWKADDAEWLKSWGRYTGWWWAWGITSNQPVISSRRDREGCATPTSRNTKETGDTKTREKTSEMKLKITSCAWWSF